MRPPGSGRRTEPEDGDGHLMARRFCQALSLGLAWISASLAQSRPARGNPSALPAEARPEAALRSLWLNSPGGGQEDFGAANRFAFFRVGASRRVSPVHPVRFRGRTGCEAPGTSSSRYLQGPGLSPCSSLSVLASGGLTDLRDARGRKRRGEAGVPDFRARWAGLQRSRVFDGRPRPPVRVCDLPVSSSLFQR